MTPAINAAKKARVSHAIHKYNHDSRSPAYGLEAADALGLAPLLFETSPQAQFLIPMAVSLGFGIVVSGFMVLFVTPAVAVIAEDLRKLVRARDPNMNPATMALSTSET